MSRISLPTPIISRSVLFGNPDKAGLQISPDGAFLGWLAPANGALNVFVAERERPDQPRQITFDEKRGVTSYMWANDGEHIIYVQDKNGDERNHIYLISTKGGSPQDLTPFSKARASILAHSRKLRSKLLITLNHRDQHSADVYELDIYSGSLTEVLRNTGFSDFLVDDNHSVRLAGQFQPAGGKVYFKPTTEGLVEWLKVSQEDSRCTFPVQLNNNGDKLYILDSRRRDEAVLASLSFDTKNSTESVFEILAEHDKADVVSYFSDLITYDPLFCNAVYERNERIILDEKVRDDLELLDANFSNWTVQNRSHDDRFWVISSGSDVVPHSAYLYDRSIGSILHLFVTRRDLIDAPLSPMQSTVIPTRDGLGMVSYLTLPIDQALQDRPLSTRNPIPLILLVHGGPWHRDIFGFNAFHQWLANRGYGVLSVNFRGSTGFGKDFINAGNREWGAKMDDDLSDAVDWAIARGIADPSRVAIMGGSYGGYATLWAISQHPDKYSCAVDIVGPSNLLTFLDTVPPEWSVFKEVLRIAVGDTATEEGREALLAKSPLTFSHKIQRPLLIGQGANDPRVVQAESDQMVKALAERGIPVTYVLFPDEGHGFARPANNIFFNIAIEQFLAQHLGGRVQVVEHGETEGHSALVTEY